MNYNGQSLSDRLQAARYTLMGSALGRGVCKATTEELGAPKKKHLDWDRLDLKQCTYGAHVSIPQLVELLIDRTRTNNWIVTFKALITIHHLLNNGNERFGSCFASCGHKLNLNKFFDRSNSTGFEMSSYIRKYAAYIDSKREMHRIAGHDLCRVKRGDDGFLRQLPTEKLFRALVVLSVPVDHLIQFKLNKSEMVNSIMGTAYRMLCRDAIRLYACFNDGIVSLLEKFFDLPRKECQEALGIYRGFLMRSEQLAQFLKNSEGFGIDRNGIPDLIKAPSSLLDTLESHFYGLESNENGASNTQQARQRQTRPESELTTMSSSDIINYQRMCAFNNEEKLMALEDEAKAIRKFSDIKRRQSSDQLPAISDGSPRAMKPNSSDLNLSILNTSAAKDLLDLNFGWDASPSSNTDLVFGEFGKNGGSGDRKGSLGISGLIDTVNQLSVAEHNNDKRLASVTEGRFQSSVPFASTLPNTSSFGIMKSPEKPFSHSHPYNINATNIVRQNSNPFASESDYHETSGSSVLMARNSLFDASLRQEFGLSHLNQSQAGPTNSPFCVPLARTNPFLDDKHSVKSNSSSATADSSQHFSLTN